MTDRVDYPSDYEYGKLIKDYVGLEKTQDLLQDNHNLLVCTYKSDMIADRARRLFFGYEDFKYLQNEAFDRDTTTKSSAFFIETEATMDDLEADLRERQRTQEPHGEKDTKVRDISIDEDTINVKLDFTIERAGKTQALDRQQRSTEIEIRELDTESATATQEFEMVNEEKAVDDFLTAWDRDRRDNDEHPLHRENVTLSNLSLDNKIELGEDLINQNLDRWRRENVEGLDVKRDESVQEEPVPELEGINEAGLSGNRLDTNDFVRLSKENGYYFTLIEVRYQHKTEARQTVVRIEFKESRRETFEVSIVSEYEEIDDTMEKANFGMQERRRIREEFRESVLEFYRDYAR